MIQNPFCVSLQKIDVKSGTLSYIDKMKDMPINIERLYWIYNVEQEAERGNHAHVNSDRVLICLKGKAKAIIENVDGEKFIFVLDDPSKILFFPRWHWINLTIDEGAVLLVACSCSFEEDEMITDYQTFKKKVLLSQSLKS
jgi:oxalate decarboxylase/phosphoglucose isomerase-like protein (cupin superfamily)